MWRGYLSLLGLGIVVGLYTMTVHPTRILLSLRLLAFGGRTILLTLVGIDSVLLGPFFHLPSKKKLSNREISRRILQLDIDHINTALSWEMIWGKQSEIE